VYLSLVPPSVISIDETSSVSTSNYGGKQIANDIKKGDISAIKVSGSKISILG
jgi:hypothetical protein